MPSFLWFISVFFLCNAASISLVKAQVTSDETLDTKVNTLNNLDFTITNGKQLGSNLFHSFQQFSVPEGGSANFANGLDIQNIFSRITGNSISEINGLIETNGNASLFLLNSNGIIFGSNAELNVGGSFIASTASQINFADGSVFSARDRPESLLTVSIPIGLQFGDNPGDIINRSTGNEGFGLSVLSDRTLALVGGNVNFESGVLFTEGGKIEIGSVDAFASVKLTSSESGWTFDYSDVNKFRDIYLSEQAAVVTRLLTEGSGEIFLQGRDIKLSGDSGILTFNEGEISGTSISVTASESVEITEDSDILSRSFVDGASANIFIDTKRLIVRDDGSFIDTLNESNIRGGDLTINATELVA